MILVLGKARCRGPEAPGWFDVSPKHCTRRDAWVGTLLWWSCQSPVAHSCSLVYHPNSFRGGTFKLNAKFGGDSLLNSSSDFECDCHTVHMLNQCCLPPPLTGTVKSSLFVHAYSSPLSLVARLHQCHENHSHYINNGQTFSGQTLCITFRQKHLIAKVTFLLSQQWWKHANIASISMCPWVTTIKDHIGCCSIA